MKSMTDLSCVLHGTNSEDAHLAMRCRVHLLQLGQPEKFGEPRENTKVLADEVRKTLETL
jgi:hypothetical protein